MGEVGAAATYETRPPRLLLFENAGRGDFTRHVLDEGTGTHEAVLRDVRHKGVLDIVGKPLHGAEKWNAHVWHNHRGGVVKA